MGVKSGLQLQHGRGSAWSWSMGAVVAGTAAGRSSPAVEQPLDSDPGGRCGDVDLAPVAAIGVGVPGEQDPLPQGVGVEPLVGPDGCADREQAEHMGGAVLAVGTVVVPSLAGRGEAVREGDRGRVEAFGELDEHLEATSDLDVVDGRPLVVGEVGTKVMSRSRRTVMGTVTIAASRAGLAASHAIVPGGLTEGAGRCG